MSPNVAPEDGGGLIFGAGISISSLGTSSLTCRICSSSLLNRMVGDILPISIFWIIVSFSFALKAKSCWDRPSFVRPSLMTLEYSSIRSDSSTTLGNFSIGACVCDGTGRGGPGRLLGNPGSCFPRLAHFWHTINVAPSTSDRAGLPTISWPQISQNKVLRNTS